MKQTQWLYGTVLAGLFLFAGAATAQVTSVLWGVNGEAWNPTNSVLRDFTDVGYMSGDVAIPTNWPVGTDVTDYGAVPDDEISDFDAFMAAISNCPPGHAIFVPKGTYWITDCLKVSDQSNFVLRGEDMYETVLYFPTNMSVLYPEAEYDYRYSVIAPPAVWWMQNGTNMNIEHVTIEFSEERMGDHFNHDGRPGIKYDSVRDSWIRNVCIKNANDGIILNVSRRITAMNIVLDQYKERPSEGENTVGHHGLVVRGARNCLYHNCFVTGRWQHDLITADKDIHNVYSRIKVIDGQLDHHAMHARENLWTDLDMGEGLRIWEQGNNISYPDETIWNVYRSTATGTTNRMFTPDPSRQNVVVGLENDDPTSIGSNWWHEAVNPYELVPQNIYLAQLAKVGKPIPGPLIDFDMYPVNPNVFTAVDDSYVGDSDSDSNFSWHPNYPCRRNPRLMLQHSANEMTAYLKFDFTDSAVTNVESAVLSIRGGMASGASVRVTAAAVTNDNWTEDTITGRNQPAESGTDLGTVTVTNTALYEFDVTDFVNQELVSGNKIVTIRLYQPDRTDFRSVFRSHEGAVWHPTITLKPDATPPQAPTGLAATAGDNLVRLDWDNNVESDLGSYNVYRSNTASNYLEIASGVITNTYVDQGAINSTMFYYVVTAVDTHDNESVYSGAALAIPAPSTNQSPAFFSDPFKETNAVENFSYEASLVDEASDPESDPMIFSKISGPDWLTVAADGTLSGIPGETDIGTNSFTVRVEAAGGSDTAELQIVVDVDTVTPPAAPTGLAAAAGVGSVSLSWGANTEWDLAGYTVYRSTTPSNGYSAVKTALSTNAYFDQGLQNETTYYYVVTATDIHTNESAASSEVTATPSATVSTFVIAMENGNFDGGSTKVVSQQLQLRNRYGTGDSDAYLRFVIDAANNTIGGVALGDITAVKLKLAVDDIRYQVSVYALDDLANPGAGFLTETTWTESNLTETNAPHGYISVEQSSSLATSLGSASGTGVTAGDAFTVDLDLTEFKSLITNSSNNEITLIITGAKDWNGYVASLANPNGYGVPTLEIGAEPALSGYDSWASGHGVGTGTNDFDSDGVSNFGEYALGGDPANAVIRGSMPLLLKAGSGFVYIHPQRSDDPALRYWVETTTNLSVGVWTNEGCVAIGTNVTGGTLDFVTNDVGILEKNKFFRLKIGQ